MATQRRQFRLTRDLVLFVAGLVGLAHETLVQETERPVLIAAFLVMMGLPAFFRLDERIQPPAKPQDEGDKSESKS